MKLFNIKKVEAPAMNRYEIILLKSEVGCWICLGKKDNHLKFNRLYISFFRKKKGIIKQKGFTIIK